MPLLDPATLQALNTVGVRVMEARSRSTGCPRRSRWADCRDGREDQDHERNRLTQISASHPGDIEGRTVHDKSGRVFKRRDQDELPVLNMETVTSTHTATCRTIGMPESGYGISANTGDARQARTISRQFGVDATRTIARTWRCSADSPKGLQCAPARPADELSALQQEGHGPDVRWSSGGGRELTAGHNRRPTRSPATGSLTKRSRRNQPEGHGGWRGGRVLDRASIRAGPGMSPNGPSVHPIHRDAAEHDRLSD